MVSVQSPPQRRELPYARVLLLPAILMAAATGAAVAMVAVPARAAVVWCGAVATLLVIATAAEAVRRGRALRTLRETSARHSAYLEQRLAGHEQELHRLGHEITPTAIYYLRGGNSPTEVIRQLGNIDPSYSELSEAQVALLKRMLDIVDTEDAMRDSSQRSFVSIARRVQAIVHQQANELREMEEDHGRNPEVFDDLLRIDHGTALIGRLADSISVLGGGRPGRQWPAPVPLYSVLRGAMSRILEYRRISLDSIAKVNIGGTSVEPVIHACAELLDNATRYSPPQTKVHVTATEVQTGIAIEIEDAGVSLSEEARAKTENMLERAKAGVDLQDLGESPRLGLAVVGRLCKTYDMQISLRSSAYGGVRAVLVVPRVMMTNDPAPGLAHGVGATAAPKLDLGDIEGPKRAPKRRRPTSPRIPAGVSMEDEVPEVTEWTAGGLPQRRSRVKIPLSQRLAEQAAAERAEREARATRPAWATPVPDPEPEPETKEPEPGLWVEAFWEGLKGDMDPTAFSQSTTEPARIEADDERDHK
ncbi:sensor histidine kinase KdpD [Streptomyces sp. NBC_00847]|uniref:sensor histidine kinase n=1 Tax=unclassified Streptomyces TaxID=2593676 RepID=UPI0022594275|nr:ATP-binding protein [Streptomyces sp. NBC_00847]MCX4879629.1 ATP-binding protein [Streptomyces sp. NBC_00847]